MWHTTPSGSRIRPFVAVGAGIKVYQGTGAQVVYQPLSNIALLTQAQDLTPLVSGGAGVKFQISPRVQFRAELHDYLTPFPNKVITPAQGAKVGGWLAGLRADDRHQLHIFSRKIRQRPGTRIGFYDSFTILVPGFRLSGFF